MNIKIGEIVSGLRREKGVTQEQFANAVGVSVPAVSKWETGQSYPDITLLPVIAEYFSVSIDALMDFNLMERDKTLSEFTKQINKHQRTGDFITGLSISREALKKYPNNFYFVYATANFLMSKGNSERTETKEQDLYDSISYFETALKLNADKKREVSIKSGIAHVYEELEQYDEAMRLFEELETGCNLAAVDIATLKYKTDDIKGAKRKVQEKLSSDIFSFGQLCRILSDCYKKEDNLKMAIEARKLCCDFLKLLTSGTPNYCDDILPDGYIYLAELYRENSQISDMWRSLNEAVYHAVRFDKNPSYNTRDIKFMDGLDDSCFANNAEDTVSKYVLKELHGKYAEFSEEPIFQKLVKELEKTAASKKEAGIWK